LNGQEVPESYTNGVAVISQPQIELELRKNEQHEHTDYNSAQVALNPNTSPESYSNGADDPNSLQSQSDSTNHNKNGHTDPHYSNGASIESPFRSTHDTISTPEEYRGETEIPIVEPAMPAEPSISRASPSDRFVDNFGNPLIGSASAAQVDSMRRNREMTQDIRQYIDNHIKQKNSTSKKTRDEDERSSDMHEKRDKASSTHEAREINDVLDDDSPDAINPYLPRFLQ
jgi:hypothetical protein